VSFLNLLGSVKIKAIAPNVSLPVIEQVAMAMLAGDTLEKILLSATEVAMSGGLDGIPLLVFLPPIAPCPGPRPDKSQ
jgi:hypothetical protein